MLKEANFFYTLKILKFCTPGNSVLKNSQSLWPDALIENFILTAHEEIIIGRSSFYIKIRGINVK